MKRYNWFFLILVTGVMFSCKPESEEELVGDWQRRQSCPGTGRCHATTFVIGNKGYVIGGYNGTNTLRREIYEFDGEKAVWRSTFPLVPVRIPARQQAVGFSLNGKGYMGTGWAYLGTDDEGTLRDFWQFDPGKYDPTIEDEEERNLSWEEAWEEVAPFPGKARRGAVAFSLQVGAKEYGFVGCGFTDGDDAEYLMDFWKFDPNGTTGEKNGKWTQLDLEHDPYEGGKRAGAAVFVVNNKAYICVGENTNGAITDFYVFDPNASTGNQWSSLRTMANANKDEDYDDDYGRLQRAWGVGYVVAVDGELRGHIVGGKAGYGYTNWEYNHHSVNEGGDLWTQRTNFYNNGSASHAREGMISFSFPNGRAFVGLGRSGISNSEDLWEFKPLIEDDTYYDYQ